MQHCVIAKSTVRREGEALLCLTLRSELTRDIICHAMTDTCVKSGFWFLTLGSDSETVVATIESSLSGLCFSLLSARKREVLAEITVSPQLTPKPVSFTLVLSPPMTGILGGMTGILGVGVSCTSYSSLEDQPHGYSAASAAAEARAEADICFLTRAPIYNSETRSFLHNFGSRVKKSDNRNFVMISGNTHELTKEEAVQTVHLRFGQLNNNEWILDYRPESFDALVAMSCVAASLTSKTLCPL